MPQMNVVYQTIITTNTTMESSKSVIETIKHPSDTSTKETTMNFQNMYGK